MRSDRGQATVVVCCGVPVGVSATDFAGWVEIAMRSRLPVTWAARPADMAMVIDVLRTKAIPCDVALALDAGQLSSRSTLRREIITAREVAGSMACVAVAGVPSLEHRSLLVEQGVHTIAVSGFDAVTRSSRRPAPAGWPCRSVVWGLWEVETVSEPPRPAIGRIVPWVVGPRVAPGTLSVVHLEGEAARPRSGMARLDRLTTWIGRQGGRVGTARLSDLPDLLRAAGQRDTGSVLRRAA